MNPTTLISPRCLGLGLLALAFALANSQPPAALAAERNPSVPAPDTVVAYKTVTKPDGSPDELKLHVFNPAGHQASDKTPCIVFFFGGGWNGGSPSQFYPHCEYLAERGMVAISAQYRTKSSHQVEPKQCVLDGKSAIRWVREHATTLGIAPDRLAAGGGSAGGQVAAAVAACTDLEESPDQPTTSCLPNALVLFNPVYDNGPDGYGNERVKSYWKEFSPLHNVHAHMPPTIAFFGTEDNLIPVATTHAFEAAMKQVGVRYDNHLYEGQGHGFFNAGRSNQPDNKSGKKSSKKSNKKPANKSVNRNDDTDYFVETVREMDLFLASLGYLQGAPTIAEFAARDTAPNEVAK